MTSVSSLTMITGRKAKVETEKAERMGTLSIGR